MGLSGKLVKKINIKSDGDVFHEIFRERPHHISDMAPDHIHSVDLHEGDWGKVGSKIVWNYTHDGKKKVAEEIIEAIDELNKSVTCRVVGGDLAQLYSNFIFTVHVDTTGEDNLVTWTLEYEKASEDVEDPNTMMDFCLAVTKAIETHHLKDEKKKSMSLRGKLVNKINIKSDGDVFHEIFRERPHHISDMAPDHVHGVDLHEGDWGKVGSKIVFNYSHDGKKKVAEEIIEAIDELNKSVTYRVVGGDLTQLYPNFIAIVHVDTTGEDNLVTWTFEYEKASEDVEDPNTLMDLCLAIAKAIETHHLNDEKKKSMSLRGKLVNKINIKSDGDVFHEIFRERPHHISDMAPDHVHGVDLHEGDWGKVGSKIVFNYTHDGKKKVAEEIIEAIDELNKSVTYRVVGGDLAQLYPNFIAIVHVDTTGEDNLVTWTFEYEKASENVEDPNTLMDLCLAITKAIETHHLKDE